ncbi:hypothetical protein HK405_014485 [Cladochytrium tenue]|nr:hypothetical protein HK405_014485 [Cladochytrium tenue]
MLATSAAATGASAAASSAFRPPASSSLLPPLPDSDGPDPASFLIESYLLSAVTAPFVVAETLSAVQFQPRAPTHDDEDSELAAYDATGVGADGAKQPPPPALIPALDSGLWDNLRDIQETPGQGWMTMFKGHLTGFIYNAAYLFLQPALEETLNDSLDVLDDTHPLTNMFSHVAVGTLLSPLELVRTRIILQSSDPANRRYYGPFHGLAVVASSDAAGGGNTLGTLYHPRHAVPTAVLLGLRALLRVASASVVHEDLGLDSDANPILFRAASLALLAVEVALLQPFELARLRLLAQRVAKPPRTAGAAAATNPHPFAAVVTLPPRWYPGAWAAVYSVVAEEGASAVSARRRRARRNAARGLPPSTPAASSSSVSSSSIGDWQELYDSGISAAAAPAATAGGARSRRRSAAATAAATPAGGYWTGIQSLYRGFWARYALEAIKFAFADIRAQTDDLLSI